MVLRNSINIAKENGARVINTEIRGYGSNNKWNKKTQRVVL